MSEKAIVSASDIAKKTVLLTEKDIDGASLSEPLHVYSKSSRC